MNIVVVLLFVVLSIGFVSVLINRGRASEAQAEVLEETQPMDAVDIIGIEERVLLNAAYEQWAIAHYIEYGSEQWYVVDRRTGAKLFSVDENTLAVSRIPTAKKSVRRTARTH